MKHTTTIVIPRWRQRVRDQDKLAEIERLVRKQYQAELTLLPAEAQKRQRIIGRITLIAAASAVREHQVIPIDRVRWSQRRGLPVIIYWSDQRAEPPAPFVPAPLSSAAVTPARPARPRPPGYTFRYH